LTDSDGGFILKKDGTPKKKGGRPQGSTSNYYYSHEQKAKQKARRAVRKKQKAIETIEKNFNQKSSLLNTPQKFSANLKQNRRNLQTRGR